NDLETAKLLITNGSQLLHTTNSQGFNAVQMAARQGRIDLLKDWNVQYLRNWGHWFLSDEHGKTLLHHAAEAGQLEVIQFLETKGLWLSRLEVHANSLLHLAAQNGQSRIVEYLCDKFVSDSNHNESLKTQNVITQFFSKKRDLIELDARNAEGETPYALALIYGHTEIANKLRRVGASAVSLPDYLLGAIYQAKNNVIQDRIATIVAHRLTVGLDIDADRNTFIHHAIKSFNYRVLRILMHPLTLEQRQAVCLMENSDRLKPLDLVIKLRRKKQLTKIQYDELDKMERALIGYHQLSYERKYRTVAQKARYHKDCANDLKREIMQSSGYYYGSMGAMIVPPLLDALQVTTNPWSLMERSVTAYFGENPLDVAERSTSLLAQNYPESTVLHYADWFFWGIGWYRHTTRNVAGEVAKFTSSMALSEAKLDEYQLLSKNYLTYLNILGATHALVETKGKQLADQYLTQYCASVEQIVTENTSIPKLDDVVNNVAKSLNATVEQLTDVNVANTVRNRYGWLRENIGQIPSTGTMWLEQLDDLILSQLVLTNPVQKCFVNQVLSVLINQYRYDDQALLQRMQSLTHYLFQGTQDEYFVNSLNEAATLLTNDGHNFGEICAQFFLGAPLYQSEYLSSENRATLALQLAREVNDFNNGIQADEISHLGNIFSQTVTRGKRLISHHITEQCYLPMLHMQDGTARIYVSDGMAALQTQWLAMPEILEQNASLLLRFFNEGTLTLDTTTILDQLALALVAQGHDYIDVMTTLTMNNQYYSRFQYNAELSTSFATHLRNQIAEVQVTSVENRVAKLNDILV
ncbi:MAG TPA: ankyrin repeat domain-containing protein, partial [Candidatus Berkiella sp.]|nr:ankyrin repeat domain-containing protein [Candidatus Berkiella sp.]